MAICYIIGAMENRRAICAGPTDYIIAADGGYAQLHGVKPDAVVGDFDSLGYVPANEKICRHPVHKDDTDMMLAVKIGLDRGYKKFVILGGLGGRLDHTIANIQVLAYLDAHGAKGCLLSESENVLLLKNDAVSFSRDAAGIVSVFAYGAPASGVTLEGLEYPLCDATLTCDFPLGVSNAFTGTPSRITVKDGSVLVIFQDDLCKSDYL